MKDNRTHYIGAVEASKMLGGVDKLTAVSAECHQNIFIKGKATVNVFVDF